MSKVPNDCSNCGGKKLPYPQGCNYCKHLSNWIPEKEEDEKDKEKE